MMLPSIPVWRLDSIVGLDLLRFALHCLFDANTQSDSSNSKMIFDARDPSGDMVWEWHDANDRAEKWHCWGCPAEGTARQKSIQSFSITVQLHDSQLQEARIWSYVGNGLRWQQNDPRWLKVIPRWPSNDTPMTPKGYPNDPKPTFRLPSDDPKMTLMRSSYDHRMTLTWSAADPHMAINDTQMTVIWYPGDHEMIPRWASMTTNVVYMTSGGP